MEIFKANSMADENLSGLSSISQPIDDPHTILKPSLAEKVGDDLGCGVVTTTVVEKTEISVVKMIQDGKKGEFMKNQEQRDGNEKVVVLGNLIGENAKGDLMDINISAEKQQNIEDKSKIFESMDEMNKKEEENVIRKDNGDWFAESEDESNGKQGGSKEEEDHDFVVGDFVWGKIKSHPWWPGQIYNPSDASDYAARLKQKGRLLVAYFGDRSFSWCSPSQLKPFINHFPEMSNQSNSKKFVNAVQTALEEVSRLVETELMCNSETVNRIDHASVVNRGIKEGVPVPKGNTIRFLMDRIEPIELLSTLKASATMDPGTGLAELELTLLKSCLNAFYSKKGGYLVEYHDPKCIEGLADKTRSRVIADSDINGPSESIDNGDDKLYQTRKQKSVAELLREEEPKIKKTKASKDGHSGKRKRKALVVSVTPESDHENGGGGVEEETMTPRQRKKSKYLSPPYLSPIGRGELSVFGSGSGSGAGSGSFKEPKTEPEKVPEIAAKHLEDSLEKSGTRSRQRRGAREGSDSQEQKKVINADVNVNKVLQGLLRVALDPTSFVEKNLPAITDFISSYRSSIFGERSSYQTKQKNNSGDTSDLAFIKQKLESMIAMVQRCEEDEMNADVKASLEGGIREVLQKVGKMKGK